MKPGQRDDHNCPSTQLGWSIGLFFPPDHPLPKEKPQGRNLRKVLRGAYSVHLSLLRSCSGFSLLPKTGFNQEQLLPYSPRAALSRGNGAIVWDLENTWVWPFPLLRAPHIPWQGFHKRAVLALSWQVEDECWELGNI